MQVFKDIFNFYSSLSTYPNISSSHFRKLAQRANLIDKKNVFLYTLDMLFSAVNFDASKNTEDNPTSELVRFEFIEMLVRLAQKLYVFNVNSLE